jgi:long-subunit acyl-CoA synthetase (AMP-forming)
MPAVGRPCEAPVRDRRRDRRGAASVRRRTEPWEPDEDATATINYTSGTTARPKGVQLTHRSLWVNADHLRLAGRRQRPRRVPAHAADVPLQRLGQPFAVTGMGGTHVILRKVDGAEILRRIEQHGVTYLCGAPAVVSMVLDAAAAWDGARSRAATACASSWPARRRRPARSSASRPSSAGSSSRSTASPRPRRCSR